MAKKPLPDEDYLRQVFEYDAESGVLSWKKRSIELCLSDHALAVWNGRYAGKEAGNIHIATGYRQVRLDGRMWQAHRLIWKMVYAVDPDDVDHINGVNADNRLDNMRDVTHAENQRNQKRRRNNRSGSPGVYQAKQSGRWIAWMRTRGEKIHIGSFSTFEDASTARREAELRAGFHLNHGRDSNSSGA